MAYVIYTDGTKRLVDKTMARKIWLVLTGHEEPNEEQAAYCEKVLNIYFDWTDPNCPDEYIQERFDIIVQLHFGDWMVHWCEPGCVENGLLTLPYNLPQLIYNPYGWAEKWGLVKHDRVTEKGGRYLQRYQPEWAAVRRLNPV